ncbi:MAG: biopolymer transporter ExbD [Treponema sp.]|jgi:biopolymer transport protein ExbD|nr:biopolymer transporter ExbD [Treponema sp.]
MKIRRRKRNSYGDSSASSDIAFLLIIYFIVIAGFNINKGFLMNLPAKNSTRLILKDDLMRFDMDSSGDIFYQGGGLGLKEAESLIGSAVSSHPNLAVVLSIDPLSPWQQVVSFVELAQKLEINSFSFNMKGDS